MVLLYYFQPKCIVNKKKTDSTSHYHKLLEGSIFFFLDFFTTMPTPLKLQQVMVKSEDLHPSCFTSVTVQTTAAAADLFLHPGPQTNVHLFDHCLTFTDTHLHPFENHHLQVATIIAAFVFMFSERVGGARVWHHDSAAATA